MTRRLAAAIAGGALILGVIAVYALGMHPMIAGSNKVAPLYARPKVPKRRAATVRRSCAFRPRRTGFEWSPPASTSPLERCG